MWIWIPIAVIAAGIVYLVFENLYITERKYKYFSDNVVGNIDGFKIVHLSDIHNAWFGRDWSGLIKKVTDCHPDLIVLTGDTVDRHTKSFKRIFSLLKQLCEIAPVYFVTGNHEYDFDDIKRNEYIDGIKKIGVCVLCDEAVKIGGGSDYFWLIGLDNQSRDRQKLKRIKSEINDSAAKILLVHQPQDISKYHELGDALVLAGHTHGGQVRIPFFGPLYVPGQGRKAKYISGRYKVGKMTLVISRGLGNSGVPVRTFCSPEIVCITLRKNAS